MVDKVGLFPWLGSGDFSYLTLMNMIFLFCLRFLATNDSLWREGIFCQSDARNAKHVQKNPLQMARGTLKMLLPAALKYAPNSAAFFFLTAGDTTDTQLCLSVF